MAELLKARASNPDVPGPNCQLYLFYGCPMFKFSASLFNYSITIKKYYVQFTMFCSAFYSVYHHHYSS